MGRRLPGELFGKLSHPAAVDDTQLYTCIHIGALQYYGHIAVHLLTLSRQAGCVCTNVLRQLLSAVDTGDAHTPANIVFQP